MKLYLSSMSPVNKAELLKLLPDGHDLSVTIVPNAWDIYPKERKELEVNNCVASFKKYGFKTSILDLTNSDKQAVEQSLKDANLVWVMGGNTFYLNFYAQKSGFGEFLKKRLNENLVYGGESAGAVLVGSTLHGIEHLDDPKLAPEIAWDGVGLLDYGLIPHWGWEKYGEYLAKAKTEMEKHGKVATIDNDEALVIIDGQSRTVKIQ